jgi:hypothetical protein
MTGEPVSTGIVVEAVSTGIATLNKMGILERVKNALISDKSGAAKSLGEVLEAIDRTFKVVEDTLVEFNSLSLETPEDRKKARRLLFAASGGTIENEMEKAKASCGNINEIYVRQLSGWFSKHLRPEEKKQIDELFKDLSRSDDAWTEMVESVAHELQRISDKLLEYIDEEEYKEAQDYHKSVVKGFKKVQKELGNGMVKFRRLKREFSGI